MWVQILLPLPIKLVIKDDSNIKITIIGIILQTGYFYIFNEEYFIFWKVYLNLSDEMFLRYNSKLSGR
ncbi:hypothetical protein [Spiroplasma endosymbiont of Dilophus febrilis]|uniref:hypothetical protein n=1 Tax=Spiroplasma endosymbiont of Dilophus febrilis TaxID=3066292 RepID=UPI00313EA432